jgi:outer membrane protein assembly factor BamB
MTGYMPTGSKKKKRIESMKKMGLILKAIPSHQKNAEQEARSTGAEPYWAYRSSRAPNRRTRNLSVSGDIFTLIRQVGAVLPSVLLLACSMDPKIRGKRELLITSVSDLEIDKSTAARTFHLPQCQNLTTWPQNLANENHNPGHLCFPVKKFRLLWKKYLGWGTADRESLLSNMVFSKNGLVCGSTDGKIIALNPKTRKILWKTKVARGDDGSKIGGLAILPQENIIVATSAGDIIQLDERTGKIKKTVNLECALRSAPAVSSDMFFVQGNNNTLFALDFQLNVLWSQMEPAEDVLFLGRSSPSVQQDVVIAAFSTGEYKAYAKDTGEEYWSESMVPLTADNTAANILHICAPSVISDSVVFTWGHNGGLAANQLFSGEKQWDIPFSGTQAPAVAGEWIFGIEQEGTLCCFEKTKGKLRWRSELPDFKERRTIPQWTEPLVLNGHILLISNFGNIVVFEAETGKITKSLQTDIRSPSAAIVVDQLLYVLSSNGSLFVFG